MPINIQYRFNYFAETDIVEFNLSVNGQGFSLGLKYDDALSLMGSIVSIAQPFFEQIKAKRQIGIREDVKAEFDEAQWERMMGETRDEQK